MKTNLLYIKENKITGAWDYIKAVTNTNGITIYNYYKSNNDNAVKSTFNKYAFVEYLKSIQVPKKYIKQVENNM